MIRRRRALAARGSRERGLTLVEVLIAASLVMVLTTAVLFGSGMLSSNRLRSGGMLVITAMRLGATRANQTGFPVRLVFDLDNHRLSLEETKDKLLRERDDGAPKGGGAEAQTEEEKAAIEYAQGVVEGPKAPRASFTPVTEFGSDGDEQGGRPFGRGVRLRQVQTAHDGAPRTSGRAYLYIWPGGESERAVVQLHRGGDDEGLSVLVSPLTGRAKIERGQVELEERGMDEDFGLREDE